MKQKKTSLIIISGIPGSGKSTFGKWVSSRYQIPYIDYDTVIQPFMTRMYAKFCEEVPYESFCGQWREACYDSFWGIIMENLNAGISVAASAPLTREMRQADFFDRLKEVYGTKFQSLSVVFDIPEKELYRRIKDRKEERDNQKLYNWTDYYKKIERQRNAAVWNPDSQIIYGVDEDYKNDWRIEEFLCGEKLHKKEEK